MDISVVVPSYNALGKLERCLTALRSLSYDIAHYEVIFVDDCSTDGTFEYLQQHAARMPNWLVFRLPVNSGSPSRPRNVGTAKASGDYVFYLDCDDELLPDTLDVHYNHAKATDACIVRGFLLADDGRQQQPMNQIAAWSPALTRLQRIEAIVAYQSTTVPSLIKRAVINAGNVCWPEDIRVGEDSIFLAELLSHCQCIEYIEHPTFIYNKRASFQASSTQQYGSRELNNHLRVWQRVINSLAVMGIDYVSLRLRVALRTAIKGLIFKNKGDVSADDFKRFTAFLAPHKTNENIAIDKFDPHVQEVLNAIYSDNFECFKRLCKPRLLIAGHDLKFISPVLPMLSDYFQIELDEWTGHDSHDVAHSEKLLAWADYIWCEWMLGNAVWYSERKKPHQKLVIRMHRFELSRDFGERINLDNTDAIVAVSLLFFERLLERFPHIPRHKVRLIHNFVDTAGYQQVNDDSRFFNLAMIGIVPFRKGLHHALELLHQLKQHDSRYNLNVFGKGPQDIPWLSNHPEEVEYYDRCNAILDSYKLNDSVAFLGHCNIKTALAKQKVGFVLSLSENSQGFPGPESFHLAIADGFAAGAQSLILRWAGAEYIYEPQFIFDSLDDIKNKILSARQVEDSNRMVMQGKALMEKYSIQKFLDSINSLYSEL